MTYHIVMKMIHTLENICLVTTSSATKKPVRTTPSYIIVALGELSDNNNPVADHMEDYVCYIFTIMSVTDSLINKWA